MKISKFQLIVLGIFVICIVAGVIAFARYKGTSSTAAYAPITIWGTFPKDTFDTYVGNISNAMAQPISVTYVQKTANQFAVEFVSALARGAGPDVILVPADTILPLEDKLSLVPYTALSQRDFRDMYVSEADIYANPNGILGMPFTLDPLVMYWNRDMFDAAGIATYPKYWDDYKNLIPKLTAKDQNGNIRKSALALGSFDNISNAREILGTLIMQTGNPITSADSTGFPVSALHSSYPVNPSSALEFFSQFADPANAEYSWNRGLPDSKSAFLSGTLATYFGFASEISDIRSKNPNLNFDVAALPQVRTGGAKAVYGRMLAFSLVQSSKNLNDAYQIIAILSSPASLAKMSSQLYLPSVRRDAIAAGNNDPYIGLFNTTALISKTWLDADPASSGQIFKEMVDSFQSGQKTATQAIDDAGDEYDAALRKAIQQ
jgi:ABC-type glycerol-3-phosphate transport system substrate-binding protein